MKNLKLLQKTMLLIVSATALLVASCSKEANPAVIGGQPYPVSGTIEGYVFPVEANASVFLYRPVGFDDIVPPDNSNGLVSNRIADEEGFFLMENIPAGDYTLKVIPGNEEYRGTELEVTVIAGHTVELNITLLKLKKGG